MKNSFRDTVIDFGKTLLASLVIVLLLRFFVMMPVTVDGRSMETTLQNGDRGFSFVITRKTGVSRFDIAVIGSPKTDYLLVKRVIGLPGEEIRCVNDQIFINDVLLEQPFLGDVHTNDFSYQLAENEYFCMGDNRDISRDSRYYGPFRDSDIRATHIFVIWPLSDFGYKK